VPLEPGDEVSFDFESWISVAFEAWHGADTENFPGPPDWTRSKVWMTHHELELHAAVDRAESERADKLAELDARVQECAEALAEAQIQHDNAERMLLTEQREDLVAAVKAMLERIGFQVEELGQPEAGQKLQDLNVRDPDGTWLALVRSRAMTHPAVDRATWRRSLAFSGSTRVSMAVRLTRAGMS
jgi:hypothetical protein